MYIVTLQNASTSAWASGRKTASSTPTLNAGTWLATNASSASSRQRATFTFARPDTTANEAKILYARAWGWHRCPSATAASTRECIGSRRRQRPAEEQQQRRQAVGTRRSRPCPDGGRESWTMKSTVEQFTHEAASVIFSCQFFVSSLLRLFWTELTNRSWCCCRCCCCRCCCCRCCCCRCCCWCYDVAVVVVIDFEFTFIT